VSTLLHTLLINLRERYPAGLPDPSTKPQLEHYSNPARKPQRVQVPEEISDVKIAMLRDQYDNSKGWEEIVLSGGGLRDTAKSVGLKDGSVVAFKFIDGDKEEAEEDDVNDGFNVQWPSYDETYPDQMEEVVEAETDEDEEVRERGDRKRKIVEDDDDEEDEDDEDDEMR
jgi:hypothetical protein